MATLSYHDSYTESENQEIQELLDNSTKRELAELLDNICRNLISADHKDFLPYYEEQLDRLRNRDKFADEVDYLSSLIRYEEKLQKYEDLQYLRPYFIDEYNKQKGVHINKDNFPFEKIVQQHQDKLSNTYVSKDEFKMATRKENSKTGLKKPAKPKFIQKAPDSDIDVLMTLSDPLLKYLIWFMTNNLDKENIALAYIIWLFTTARLCCSDSSHHTLEERSFSSGKRSVHSLKEEYDILNKEYTELKKSAVKKQ